MQLDRFLQDMANTFLGGGNREQDEEERYRNARPASEDPYGDPADSGEFGNLRPASEDPYGDPADSGEYANARPASEDPYGDPADREYS
ncbi:MAG: translation initiation factor [Oscillatoria princeps RMCB-10]|jgi:hypothetical protein|nr:translation initiation factor [Oscillatoria princeps RMCB-10]